MTHPNSNSPNAGDRHRALAEGELRAYQDDTSMVLVPPGPFVMGSQAGSAAEAPAHEVHLDAFWLDRTPVTNRAYRTFIENSGYRTEAEVSGGASAFYTGRYQHVGGLSWKSYATPGSPGASGRACHLERCRRFLRLGWVKTAHRSRVGEGSARRYHQRDVPPGETLPPMAPSLTSPGRSATYQLPPESTSTRRTDFGFSDMVGNVWQWCSDWYADYEEGPVKNPTGPTFGTTRVRRGGSWNVIQPFRLRCANRGAMPPSQTATNMGFRCARS